MTSSGTAPTVVVTSVTGTQSASVAGALLDAGWRVRGTTRSGAAPAGVQPVPADLTDARALAAAFAGADAAVVGLPLQFDPVLAARQADALVAALGRSGVPHVVLNPGSPLPPAPVGVPFVDVRVDLAARLASTVATVSVVAPAATYLENLAAPWSAPLVDEGVVRYPLPAAAPVPWVAAADLGTAVAGVLRDPVPAAVVPGPSALTGPEVAAELAAALGHPVRWETVTPVEYARMLAPHLGSATAAGIAAIYEAGPAPGPAEGTAVLTGATGAREWAARVWVTRRGLARV